MENFGFELIDDQGIEQLLDGADSENTKKAVKYSVNRLEQYEKYVGEKAPVQSEEKLDHFLTKFFASLRQKNGELYQKKSMQTIRYGLQRHFMRFGYNIVEGPDFKNSNKVWKAMMVKLKKAGKGSVTHKSPIGKGDMDKIQNSSALDISTPEGLQNKVFMDLMMYFGNRGRENVRSMTPEDYIMQTDEDGLRYIIHRDMMTKTRRAEDDESFSGSMYEIPGSERCPVTTFLDYVGKLNNNLPGVLWQRPKKQTTDQGEWYDAVPVGKNTLYDKMKNISKSSGCSKIYTNHSLRATCVTMLDNAGFASRDIMSVSGHKSESSLKHYVKTSDAKKKCMSSVLAQQMNQQATAITLADVPSTSSAAITSAKQQDEQPYVEIKLNDEQQQALIDGSSTSLLSSSQEKIVLREMTQSSSTMNISSSTTKESIQNFHFHGSVVFYNMAK